MKLLLPLLTLLGIARTVTAHGRLTVPTPRRWKKGITCDFSKYAEEADEESKNFPCMEDPDQPINMDNKLFPKNKYNDARYPVNYPTTHPGRQSLVCRVPNGMQDTTVPVPKLKAGKTFKVKWEFTADHPGDGGIYISYDHDYGTEQTQNMRFFKIANLPQQRLLNKVEVDVKLPAWVPPGKAVLRWDWYATHNPPWVEFYSNCVDVDIVSTSKVLPTAIPSYTMQSGTGSKDAYPKYYCSEDDSCSDWCFDCDAEAWEKLKVNGPACAPGISGSSTTRKTARASGRIRSTAGRLWLCSSWQAEAALVYHSGWLSEDQSCS